MSTPSKETSKHLIGLISGVLMLAICFIAPSAFAEFDYIFFSINGDTTLSTLTQGDEFTWGSNCDSGATINWEIWYDANASSSIEKSSDVLLVSENITDGSLLSEGNSEPDGWILTPPFNLSLEPGDYIFKATDIVLDSSLQKTATMVAMSSPPNQFTGQISLPGVTPPNSLLANRLIFAESETGEEGVFGAFTDNQGQYAMNVGSAGTGVDFYLFTSDISGFVAPSEIIATASGVVGNNDFSFVSAVDSVWGFVKDETGTVIPFESDVSAESDDFRKETTTLNGRYVIYFSSSDKGNWNIESSSINSPIFLSMDRFYFSHDTVNSFQYDIVLTRTDTVIFARITENGGLPSSNYQIDAYSPLLGSWAEAVSGTGTDNIAEIAVSSLDDSGWEVYLNQYDDDFPFPEGLILEVGMYQDVAPGDTVDFNFIGGNLVSGNITQDPEDDPIFWDEVWVNADFYGSNVDGGGAYSFYVDSGTYSLSVYAEGYITDPAWRYLDVTGDTTSGLDFVINRTHCRVSGSLTNVTLPLDNSYYEVTARTGNSGEDGYFVSAQVDSVSGTYTMDLCDGDWIITPPNSFPDATAPDSVNITIGESPDTVKTVDFAYSNSCCIGFTGNADCSISEDPDITDITRIIDFLYLSHAPLCCPEEADNDGSGGYPDTDPDITDITRLIDFLYLSHTPLPDCP